MSEANRMRNIVLRFDMRCATQSPNTPAERYRCALEMSQWADRNAVDVVGLSEHHDTTGGVPLHIGWNSLQLFEEKVQPYL